MVETVVKSIPLTHKYTTALIDTPNTHKYMTALIDTPNTQVYDRSISWLGKGISIKSDWV
jgi:hypothetical protein